MLPRMRHRTWPHQAARNFDLQRVVGKRGIGGDKGLSVTKVDLNAVLANRVHQLLKFASSL